MTNRLLLSTLNAAVVFASLTVSGPSALAASPKSNPVQAAPTVQLSAQELDGRRLLRMNQMWGMYLVRNRTVFPQADLSKLYTLKDEVSPTRLSKLSTAEVSELIKKHSGILKELLIKEGKRRIQTVDESDPYYRAASLQATYLKTTLLPSSIRPEIYNVSEKKFNDEFRTAFENPALIEAERQKAQIAIEAAKEKLAADLAERAAARETERRPETATRN